MPTFRLNISRIVNHIINMSRTETELQGVTLLGCQGTKYSDQYNPEVLESFKNKHPENEYLVSFTCPEFTSLCPKTGQPDFGKIIINYIPREDMVESKSLKLYLFSFRNHGDFHEDCVNIIMKDLVKLMNPRYLEVKGIFMPRGGISILPFANYADEEHEEMRKARLLANFTENF
jgi:7-cyano-7-deazaguanine reductase